MKVLIVDDDAIQRMLLTDMLQRFDQVEVVEAEDGDAAWKALEDGLRPVLCCCDMRMPGMSGLELLRQVRSRPALADIPFVFITAATDRDTIREVIAAGVANYILKPLDINKARASLDKLFRGIRERHGEDPATTQKRLRLAPEKLLGFYDALAQQIGAARASAATDAAAAGARLDGLKTGCRVLGLWHPASMIEHLVATETGLLERILGDIESMVALQARRARIEFGIRQPPVAKKAEPAATPEVEQEEHEA